MNGSVTHRFIQIIRSAGLPEVGIDGDIHPKFLPQLPFLYCLVAWRRGPYHPAPARRAPSAHCACTHYDEAFSILSTHFWVHPVIAVEDQSPEMDLIRADAGKGPASDRATPRGCPAQHLQTSPARHVCNSADPSSSRHMWALTPSAFPFVRVG